jgi:tetratricopeptide (TPR) repeat protein
MKRSRWGRGFFTLAAAIVALASCGRSGWTTIEDEARVFKTYAYSEPDPVPVFARPGSGGRGERLYPYFFFDGFSRTAIEKSWNVVRLENPYLSVSVLPQVGGKVWGATDKRDGAEFLYTNHVMKFREIALRGPWTSGGIEFNFGFIGHTPSTAAPVDYALRRNRDGSVSCVVGNLDLPSRTFWSVEVNLPPDKAFFRTRTQWFNPTPFHQSYYNWMTAALPTADDLEYISPGRFQIGHDYSVPLEPWPLDGRGHDLSKYRDNAFGSSKSYFTVGEYEDTSGAYYRDADKGFGHWALYDDMPGRKIWIWDLSRAGAIWEDLLTDEDGQYSEPQFGRLFNQSDHEFLTPSRTDRWSEVWFPYSKIGPLVKASAWAVLNAEHRDGALKIALFSLQALDDDLTVTTGGAEVFRERLRLEPARVYQKTVRLEAAGVPYEIRLAANKLVYRSDPKANDIERPLRFRPDDESTTEGIYLAADRLHKERQYGLALEKYLACIAREPRHVRSLVRTAELFSRRGEDGKGLGYARTALDHSMYDPAANYIYGVISRRLERLVDAKEALGWAARSLEFRSGAYGLLAEIALQENDADLALEYAGRALETNAFNFNALDVQATALRLNDERGPAVNVINRILDADPLHHLARFEGYLLNPGPASLKAFQSNIRNEFPQETYLELALYYVRLGLHRDAVRLLKLSPESPTVCARLAYLTKADSPAESAAHLEKAFQLSPWLVFPFREEDIPVYEWAIRERPSDWKPQYYLGLLLWSKGRLDEAKALFEGCSGVDFAPFFLTRSALYLDGAPGKAAADLRQALALDPKTWRTWHALSRFTIETGLKAESLETTAGAMELFPDDVSIQVDRVKALLGNGRPRDAAAFLDRIEALPSEGASALHSLFVRSHILIALDEIRKRDYRAALKSLDLAKTYPERLGSGQPFDPDWRLQDYLRAVCFERLNDKDQAAAIRKTIRDLTDAELESRLRSLRRAHKP